MARKVDFPETIYVGQFREPLRLTRKNLPPDTYWKAHPGYFHHGTTVGVYKLVEVKTVKVELE